MSRSSIHISIPKPCHEQWDGMTATERGAFCQSCQTEVIDFSTMTDREVVEYLSKNKAGCGRFRNDQLDTNLTIPSVENGMFKWRALLFSFLSLISIKSLIAQSEHLPSTKKTSISNNQNSNSNDKDGVIHLSGKVLDENNEGLIGVNVVLLDSLGRSTGIGVCTDFDGNFSLEVRKKSSYLIRCSYVNYYAEDNKVTDEAYQSFMIKLKPKLTGKSLKATPMRTKGLIDVTDFPKDTLRH